MNITKQQIVDRLNELLALDGQAMQSITGNYVVCNRAIAESDKIIVGLWGNNYRVGMIGILNGLFPDDGEYIGANYDKRSSEPGKGILKEYRIYKGHMMNTGL